MIAFVVFLLVLWVACMVVTVKLFKRSGRTGYLGFLVGLVLRPNLGPLVGLLMIAKGPPKPDGHWGLPKNTDLDAFPTPPTPPGQPPYPYG